MALTPEQIESNVEECVFGYLVGSLESVEGPDYVDRTKTFGGAPPKGYGLLPAIYGTLCKATETCINQDCGSAIKLTNEWCQDHYNQPISAFLEDAAKLVVAGPHV